MSLRLRLTLFVVGAVTVAVTAVATAAYISAANEVYGEVDEFLEQRVRSLGAFTVFDGEGDDPLRLADDPIMGMGMGIGGRGSRFVQPDSVVQILSSDGAVFATSAPLPVDDVDLEVISGVRPPTLHTVELEGEQFRVITAPFTIPIIGDHPLGAVQVGRSLAEALAVLDGMKVRMLTMGGIGVALAALAGWLIAGRALRPVGELTAAAEHVAATQDLESPIDVEQDDEVGRLANSFNAMLGALADSKRQQQQLVADAGHELRTPLTSLRTNIELLSRAESLPDDQRRELMDDATTELEQLSELVGELVDLATDRSIEEPPTDVRLDQLVESVAKRAQRRWDREVRVIVEPTVVHARAGGVERAVSNLVDNAVKWGSPGDPIEVLQRGGKVTVRDHGPGIDAGDQARIFDRFYRATTARTMPGSGLGLAIVRQITEEHGGTVSAANAPSGGAIVGFELPGAEAVDGKQQA
jgi:two-component system sensor histidine kinase MprB